MNRQNVLIVGLLSIVTLSLLLPSLVSARVKANRSVSQDHLRTIGQGFQAYVDAYGFFPSNGGPPMEVVDTPNVRTGFPDSEAFRWGYGDPKRAGRLQTGCWAYSILPFIGEQDAFRTQDHTRAVPTYYIPARREAKAQHVPKVDPVYAKWTYFDAGLGPWGRTDYAANDQVIRGGMGNVTKPIEVKDGLAETALAAEKVLDTRAIKSGGWYWDEPIILGGSGGTGRKGSKLYRDADHLLEEVADSWGSPDPHGVWFLFCDGHTQFFKYDTPKSNIAAIISPRGGEKLPD